MRVYINTTEETAIRLLKHQRWEDLHTDLGMRGLWCEDRPRGPFRKASGAGVVMGMGPEGDVVLCADLPEEVFRGLEVSEGVRSLTDEESKRVVEDESYEPE